MSDLDELRKSLSEVEIAELVQIGGMPVRRLAFERDVIKAEVARLREALRPFANAWRAGVRRNVALPMQDLRAVWRDGMMVAGDFERAAAALDAKEADHDRR